MSNANEMINNDYFYYFHERLADGFKNSSFNMSEWNTTMYYAIDDLVDAVYIDDHIQQDNHDQFWKPAYHYKYGLCYTLDIKNNMEKVESEKFDDILISLKIDQINYPYHIWPNWKEDAGENMRYVLGLMHDKDGLSFAAQQSSTLWFSPRLKNSAYRIRKTKVTSQSTLNNPCGQMFPQTCKDTEFKAFLRERFNCTLPFFNIFTDDYR